MIVAGRVIFCALFTGRTDIGAGGEGDGVDTTGRNDAVPLIFDAGGVLVDHSLIPLVSFRDCSVCETYRPKSVEKKQRKTDD